MFGPGLRVVYSAIEHRPPAAEVVPTVSGVCRPASNPMLCGGVVEGVGRPIKLAQHQDIINVDPEIIPVALSENPFLVSSRPSVASAGYRCHTPSFYLGEIQGASIRPHEIEVARV